MRPTDRIDRPVTDREQRAERKVVIVTGASKGLGAGLVAAYRSRGWAVVANSRTIQPTADPELLSVPGDVSEPGTADRIVSAAMDRFGRIDTLVNNAGVFVSKPFLEYSIDDYARVVGVNVTAFFMLTQRAIAEMVPQGGGHIVNITSTLVDFADSEVPAALTALTKGGLAAVTRSLAIEYAARGIRVNAVSPGIIETSPLDDDVRRDLAAHHPLGRVGRVDDLIEGILFLEASPFITGEILHIDGGQIAGR
jgi:NAD(P)-dependent dehydrogenase (short-subunit alcohol dehydrogenase family)